MMIDVNKEYTAVIETNYGKISVRFFPKEAPLTVNNFVFLAREGYYNNVKIHRIVKGFVIQSGDATRGDGTGGPGYRFPDEPIVRGYKAGTLAMANSGPNTNGSQFFICLEDLNTRLAKSYTIFGEVTGGFDVVLAIGNLPVSGQTPTVDVRILSVTIQEK
jgi:cyclophilin family peptidyl-prolyl cis-trans isomerase